MKIAVEKYGGTSVASLEHIKSVAKRVVATKEKGFAMLVVVSAMGQTTDELLEQAYAIGKEPSKRELSMLASTGEIISSSLLAVALQGLGCKAVSVTGSQCGITTDDDYTNARILDIDYRRILGLLQGGNIVVAAGFQGTMGDNEITVLGRGGSDVSAVALAVALKAEYCHIHTDVDGVYSADPRVVSNAKLLDEIHFDEMLEMASCGAAVIMTRSVELARKNNLELKVSSGLHESKGTLIKGGTKMEKQLITGIAHNKQIALFNLEYPSQKEGYTSYLLDKIAEKKVKIIIFSMNQSTEGRATLSVVVHSEDESAFLNILENENARSDTFDFTRFPDSALVSVVGFGIAHNFAIPSNVVSILQKNNIEVKMIGTSELKICAVLPAEESERAVNILHDNLILNKNGGRTVARVS